MNKGFMFNTTVATIKHRAEAGGASPGKDDTANGNGNGNSHVDADTTKSSNKKKKKNKKRNSRASLTAEDDANGAEDDEETVDEAVGAAAPSSIVMTDANESTTVAADEETTPEIAWSSPANDDDLSLLLDLPSPAPVSSGSPFDVFDNLNSTTTSSDAFPSVTMLPSTPAADAASVRAAAEPENMFAARAQSPARRAPPPPPPPVPFNLAGAAPVFVSTTSSPPPSPVVQTVTPPPASPLLPTARPSPASPAMQAALPSPPSPVFPGARPSPPSPVLQASPPSPSPPELPASPIAPLSPMSLVQTALPDSQMHADASPISVEALTASPPAAQSATIAAPASPPHATTNESFSLTTEVPVVEFEAPSPAAPAPAINADPEPVTASVDSEPAFLQEDTEPLETLTTVTSIHLDAFADTVASTGKDDTATDAFAYSSETKNDTFHGNNTADPVEVEAHLDTSIDSPAEASSSPSREPLIVDVESIATESATLPVAAKAASVPLAPVVAKAQIAKSSPTVVRSSKPSSNGASTTGVKPAVTKPSVSTKQAASHDVANATTKAVPKTTSPRTPTKQTPKVLMASPSTAPVPPKATASRTTLQRSLSGSAAGKTPARSPTSSAATAAKSGSSSPTTPSPASGDTEPKAKKKLSASEIDAAGNRLYEQAMESKRRLEAKKALREEEFSFTPQVNAKSKKLDNGDAPNRFVLLHERAKEAQRKKEELREKLEKEQCTFKPQITNKAKKIASTSDRPRFENLYRNAQEIQAKREEKKQELKKNEEELTFKPKIKAAKSPVRSRPLYDEELVKQKRLEREQKKLEAEQQAKPKAVKKVKAQDGDNTFFDRMQQAELQRAERLAKLKQERDDKEMAGMTFQPKVSSARSTAKPSSQPFHQRLFDKDHLKKVAAEREQKKLEEEKKRFSFKPRVSDMPDSVKSKGSSDGGSTGKSSIFERLYQDKDRVKEKIDLSEELKIQKELEACTFRPQIDPPVSAGGSKGEPATPIWERLLSIDKNQIADERERLKAQQELEACTFRPEISGLTPGSVSPKRASTSNIFDRLSTSAGNTPVDDKKRRPSERTSIAIEGKRNSYNEVGHEGPEGDSIEC